ncbi:DNA-binding transcriptional regulator, MarR family [Thermomonospora echinospora]|uniref:DNA-binding transcriptional regulator, MarR family n=1 Tax=Thermomonospora echinospora TaxID=1992 RepID=A0A1H6B780_9ACTN|nr:MarR family winged helix-turn-helix transcriptional regulator [Thermomonospora echinospora]SEG55986.1 DNA-binding transcriptional regulator, MarR family [Thermomonospora echinospora]
MLTTSAAPVRTVPDLAALLNHAGHVLHTRLAAALDEIDVTPRAICVLIHAMEAERTQAELAELADLDKTTMVVTVDALEKAGLAERRTSSTDRRARIVSVTEAGARKARAGVEIVDAVHRGVLEALPEEEREVFVSALERLVAGHLAVPAESGRPVRRARTARK